ncbi:unnamed protein product [Prorocentrum cordatum]|uniref:Uncharacterized protein n=1 Tax=Prorocentrum cordatum TaxID=2364126 RepID=A0ABN9X098_9DINO|nr:unnamed protein product [Polarella glacialis]
MSFARASATSGMAPKQIVAFNTTRSSLEAHALKSSTVVVSAALKTIRNRLQAIALASAQAKRAGDHSASPVARVHQSAERLQKRDAPRASHPPPSHPPVAHLHETPPILGCAAAAARRLGNAHPALAARTGGYGKKGGTAREEAFLEGGCF